MKYICTKNEKNEEEIFIFPSTIDHDAMAEVLSLIKDQTHGNWNRVHRKPVSAGFITVNGTCHGRSETLGLASRGDTDAKLRTE